MHFILYKQLTGKTIGQEKCAKEFQVRATLFKCVLLGKWQKGSGICKGEGKLTRKSKRLLVQVKEKEKAKKPKTSKDNDDDKEEEQW